MLESTQLLKKLRYFDNIIFDLDNTLISLPKYDLLVFKKVCFTLEKNLKKRKIILSKLLLLRKKELKLNKKINIFDKIFLSKQKSNKAFQIYNKYFPKEFTINKKIFFLLSQLKLSKKKIYLVTNGNQKRQLQKIKKLKIYKFFTKIFILDGKKYKFKPSISSVGSLRRNIKNKKNIMVGDSKIDKKFAINLKVKYIKFISI